MEIIYIDVSSNKHTYELYIELSFVSLIHRHLESFHQMLKDGEERSNGFLLGAP